MADTPSLWAQIERDFGLKGLARLAKQDTLKGQDSGNDYGTSFTAEGHLLYALVRALARGTPGKPRYRGHALAVCFRVFLETFVGYSSVKFVLFWHHNQ